MILARVGDVVVGICYGPDGPYPATGVITTGSPRNVETGTPVSRVSDAVMWPCGISIIVTGSPRYIESGVPVARIGDSVQGIGTGIITTGSPRYMEA